TPRNQSTKGHGGDGRPRVSVNTPPGLKSHGCALQHASCGHRSTRGLPVRNIVLAACASRSRTSSPEGHAWVCIPELYFSPHAPQAEQSRVVWAGSTNITCLPPHAASQAKMVRHWPQPASLMFVSGFLSWWAARLLPPGAVSPPTAVPGAGPVIPGCPCMRFERSPLPDQGWSARGLLPQAHSLLGSWVPDTDASARAPSGGDSPAAATAPADVCAPV